MAGLSDAEVGLSPKAGLSDADVGIIPTEAGPDVAAIPGWQGGSTAPASTGGTGFFSPANITATLKAFGQGASEDWKEALGLSPEATAMLSKAGIFAQDKDRYSNPFHAMNELLAETVYRSAQIAFRAGGSVLHGGQAAVFTALGEGPFARDVAALPEAFFGSPHPLGIPKRLPEPVKAAERAAEPPNVSRATEEPERPPEQAVVPEPPVEPPASPNLRTIWPAFERLAEERGAPYVKIADLIDQSGLSKEAVHDLLLTEAKRGNVVLSHGETPWAKLPKDVQDAAIRVEGEEPYTIARIKPEAVAPPTVDLGAARELGVVGPDKPEATFNDSPSELAERAVPGPRDLGGAATPEGERPASLGHGPGEYDERGKAWIKKIDEPDDVRDAIEKIASENDFFPVARGGEASPASVAAVAEAAGVSPAEISSSHFSAHFDSDGKVRAVIQVLRQTAKDYADAAKAAAENPTTETLAAAAEAELRHGHVVEYTMGLRAESGRTLAAWKDLLRETEQSKATVALRSQEQTGAVPKGAADVVDAVGEVQTNLKADKKPGLQKLVDAARGLVENADKPAEPGTPKTPMSPEVQSLVDEARNVLKRFASGDKTELDKLIDAAEKQAVNMTKQKVVKDPVEALPPELQALVDKTKRVVNRFGGVATGERAALLLARTGRTAAEQEQLARSVYGLTPNQVAKVLNKVRESPEAGKPGWFYWLWQQGLISGLITHSKYLAVNTATVFLERVISPFFGAVLDRARGQNTSIAGPLYANVAMVHSLPDAVAAAAQAFKTGLRVPLESEMRLYARGEESPQAKGAAAAYNTTPSPNWGIWNRVFNETQLNAAAKVLGIPGKSANMIHTFYKVLSERAAASTRAFQAAHEEGVKGDKFWDRYQHHLDNPTDEALRGAVNDAYTGAFMAELGPKLTTFSRALSKNPVTKWLFPFQHIPWNIERMTIEYSPFAVLGPEMRGALLGRKGVPAQNLAIAKMVVGSSVLGYFVHKALSETATGEYPHEQKERAKWGLLGIQANSIQMGGEWVSYERLGPIGNVAHMGAAIGSIIKHYDGQDDNALTSAIWSASVAAANQVGNEVGFQSLKNLMESLENEKKASRFVAWQVGSFMPFSSFVTQNASIVDPYQRKANSIIDGLRYRVPLLRETLTPKRDPLFGEPLPNPSYHTITPMGPVATDPIKLELARANYFPTEPEDHIGGVKLTPKLYDEYQVRAGALVRTTLERTMRQPGWFDLPPYVRGEVLRKSVQAARQAAGTMVQAAHPEIIQQGMDNRKAVINGAKPTKLKDAD